MRSSRSAADPTTAVLVAAACAGEDRAWAELHRRHTGLVGCVVASYRLQEADAADAAASTWLRAVERIDGLRDGDRFGAWLRTIAARECLALIRRARREPPVDVWLADRAAEAPGPELMALGGEASRAIGAALDGLGGRSRNLIELMVTLPDAGYTEIARRTGMPVGSIGPTRGRALRRMRTDLEHAGFGEPVAAAS